MKKFVNFRFVVLFVLVILADTAMYGQDNVIDEVVWVVGDEAILKSEVEEARLSALYDGRKIDGDPYWPYKNCFYIRRVLIVSRFPKVKLFNEWTR